MEDKTIFQFDSVKYQRDEVEALSFSTCEHLSNEDETYVTKFDGRELQDLLNDNVLDIDGCWYRVF